MSSSEVPTVAIEQLSASVDQDVRVRGWLYKRTVFSVGSSSPVSRAQTPPADP